MVGEFLRLLFGCSHSARTLRIFPARRKTPCRSEPARDSGVSVDRCLTDPPLSRAGSLLQGICVEFRDCHPPEMTKPGQGRAVGGLLILS
ncbi:hypothetical protein PkoCFBP13504_29490 [Pseudomonas koreensis]|nr:hypothetical protein PkoCFBP13504_29490 [Pseudomonas koreensis]